MKKTYLVKKNHNMPNSEDNWIMMNGFEFARFMETPEGQNRKDNFERLPSIGCEDEMIIAECGVERAKEWKAERNAHEYLVEQENESGIETLSFDALDSEEDEVTGEELMVDEDCDVVADVMTKIDRENLFAALNSLDSDEYKLISEMYLSESHLSERDEAQILGISCVAVHKRKNKILEKMKKYF